MEEPFDRIASCSSDFMMMHIYSEISTFSESYTYNSPPILNDQQIARKYLKRRVQISKSLKATTKNNLRRTTTKTTTRTTTKTTTTTNFLLRCLLWMFFVIFIIVKTTNCQQQQYTEDERNLVTGLLLKRFGLQELQEPIRQGLRSSRTTKISSYIMDLYESVEIGEHDQIRHYVPARVKKSYSRRSSEAWIIRYNLTAIGRIPEQEWVYRADLRIPIYKLLLSLNISTTTLQQPINLYKLDGDNRTEFVNSKVPNLIWNFSNRTNTNRRKLLKTTKWMDFDVGYVLQENALNKQSDVIDFLVEIDSFPLKQKKHSNIAKDLENKAALIVYVEELKEATTKKVQKRVKREVVKSHKRRHHNKQHRKYSLPKDSTQCRRTEMYVDFAELNWKDWILAPVGYEAYQCRGQCPHPIPSQMNTTNHAIIQSLINSIDPSAVPPPSCVPVEMGSLSILYKDINNVVALKKYPDMLVEACGCH